MAAKIKKGDRVVVTTGRDKGKQGPGLEGVSPTEARVLVSGVNMVKRHQAPNGAAAQGGIISKEAPIHGSPEGRACGSARRATRRASVCQDGWPMANRMVPCSPGSPVRYIDV